MGQEWGRIFPSLEAGVGAELLGEVPEALYERVIGDVFFRWSDPDHAGGTRKRRTIGVYRWKLQTRKKNHWIQRNCLYKVMNAPEFKGMERLI